MVVLFPDPFGPISPYTSPAPTSSERSSTATTSSFLKGKRKILVNPSIRTAGGDALAISGTMEKPTIYWRSKPRKQQALTTFRGGLDGILCASILATACGKGLPPLPCPGIQPFREPGSQLDIQVAPASPGQGQALAGKA